MKFLKMSFLLLSLIFLNGCLQSTAMIGPGVTLATTGNIFQAGFQYGANTAIKNETGKNTLEHIKQAVDSKNEKKKFKMQFTEIVKKRFEITRKKLSTN
tara:strand:+ start:1023 stop:1319 length:297 start_codon:yes stop_codon:yes gene_type:complete